MPVNVVMFNKDLTHVVSGGILLGFPLSSPLRLRHNRAVVSRYKSSLFAKKQNTLALQSSTIPLYTRMTTWHRGPTTCCVLLAFSILIFELLENSNLNLVLMVRQKDQ